MNFGEILSDYEQRTGAPTNRAYLAGLINEAQVEIAKRYGSVKREEYYSVEKGEEHVLPSDHLQTKEVRDGNNNICTNYEITPDGKIYFPADGDYVLFYAKLPEQIDKDNNDAKPDVHPIFYGMIVQYCVAKWWEDRSEGIPAEEAKADKTLAEFYRKVDEATHILRQRAFSRHQIGIHPMARGY